MKKNKLKYHLTKIIIFLIKSIIFLFKVLYFLLEPILSILGYPIEFKKIIKEHPDVKFKFKNLKKNIRFGHVVNWDEWFSINPNNHIRLDYSVDNTRRLMEDIKNIASIKKIDNWKCDIQEIKGISSSKSDLSKFDLLDSFAEINCGRFILDISEESLNKNLMWEDGDIFKRANFTACKWNDNEIKLQNGGGSHHFSAARYIAKKLGTNVTVSGTLKHKSLVDNCVYSIINAIDMYAIPTHKESYFHYAINSFKADAIFLEPPRPFNGFVLICFYRNSIRSRIVSKLFKKSGFFYFNSFLLNELEKNVRKEKNV